MAERQISNGRLATGASTVLALTLIAAACSNAKTGGRQGIQSSTKPAPPAQKPGTQEPLDKVKAGPTPPSVDLHITSALPNGQVSLVLHPGPALSPPTELVPADANGLGGVVDAQHDAAGNLWAVSSSHLYLRRAGFQAFESFNTSQGLYNEPILSVGGGTAGVAWVGHDGQGYGDDTDPSDWWTTGGVDKVVLNGAGIDVTYYPLVSPPGTYSQYPGGRYKLRHTYRIYPVKTGPRAGDAWFGCNHGTALVNAHGHEYEHHHPDLCIWDPATNDCMLKIGNVPAVAFTPEGNLWFGGTYGIGELMYNDGSAEGNFWGAEPIRNTSVFASQLNPNTNDQDNVVGVAVAQDGTIWAASADSGLAHRFQDGSVEIYQTQQGLPTNSFVDMATDSANGLWLVTAGDGVYRLDLANGELRRASNLPSDNGFRVMHEVTNVGEFITIPMEGGVAIYSGNTVP